MNYYQNYPNPTNYRRVSMSRTLRKNHYSLWDSAKNKFILSNLSKKGVYWKSIPKRDYFKKLNEIEVTGVTLKAIYGKCYLDGDSQVNSMCKVMWNRKYRRREKIKLRVNKEDYNNTKYKKHILFNFG